MSALAPSVGRALPRVEDERFITGTGSYIADIDREGQVHARVARSPVAHGHLRGVDLEAVRSRPDVLGAFAAADLPGIIELRIPVRLSPPPQAEFALQPPLAVDRVRYVGEPLAVVVADDPYAAEDAAEAITLEIDELEPVLDPVAAADPAAAILHPGLEGNIVGSLEFKHGDDVDRLFAQADALVSDRLYMHRHSAVAMETRGLLAELGDDGRLTVWGPTKVKHHNRGILAAMLRIDEHRIRLVEPDVGGSFGTRGEFYPEDFLIPWLALKLGRPVKWIEDRTENLTATNQSRERVYEIEIAARADGTLLAFRSRDWCGLGGYLRTAGMKVPEISGRHIAGPYRWPGFEATTHGVMTNKTPLGTYRGPGESEATFARERMIDRLARELGADPAELRLRNLIRPEDLPYRIDFGDGLQPVVHESGDYPRQFSELLDHVDYDGLRARTTARGDARTRAGLGVACFINEGSYGPFEWARVVARSDGSFVGYVGAASFGQGVQTALGQVLADALGVAHDRVSISHHDTDLVEDGIGSWADRTTALAGSAIVIAVEELKRDARGRGAAALAIAEDELEVVGDSVRELGGTRELAFGELGCEGTGRFERPGMAFSFAASIAMVAVEMETGTIEVERYVGAYDVGRAINPMTVRGQLAGAAAQGIAGALFEEFAYDADGRPLSTSLFDYVMPSLSDLPEAESLVFEFPAPDNLLGVKGAGNPGIVGTYAALANGVSDALDELGIQVSGLPMRASAIRDRLDHVSPLEPDEISLRSR